MANKCLSLLLFLLFILALLLPFLPVALYTLTPAFAGKALLSGVFALLALEKLWAMFFRMKQRYAPKVEKDWTTVSVGYAFAAVYYFALFDFFFRQQDSVCPMVSCAGLVIYAIAVAIRYWAFHHLSHQWAIHVDKEIGDRKLVTDGPYAYVRHPLYLGACLETIGIPLLLGSYWTLLFAVVVFIPVECQRAYFEERYLRKIFGDEYDKFSERTWAFFPLPGKRSKNGA